MLSEINELVVQEASRSSDDTDDREGEASGGAQESSASAASEQVGAGGSEQEPPNSGSLLMDASCTPADIRYPGDLSLLNEAREKTEEIIDVLHRPDIGRTVKPRTYRNLLVCGEVYRQQKLMYDSHTRSVSGRIVSISQPHVRPIVRGNAGASVEFGAKTCRRR